MSLPLQGRALSLVGFPSETHRVVRTQLPNSHPRSEADAALIRTPADVDAAVTAGFAAAIAFGETSFLSSSDVPFRHFVTLDDRFGYLRPGDILAIDRKTGHFRSLFRQSSSHNSFLVTERCNHYCLMCSQPPRDVQDDWIIGEIERAIPLISTLTQSLGFTGGEPLLEWRRFIGLLRSCRDILPDTAIHVLTNGRAFAQTEIVSAWTELQHPALTAGIPIYSTVASTHDYVVQAKGAFDETILGILKLKDRGQRVEIRIVLHAITARDIRRTCEWIARNLAFVDHVALMGLENTGFALANDEALWIDPVDYTDDLAKGIEVLTDFGVRASIYNLQRCLLPHSVWGYARQSISDWKNAYLKICETCSERDRCTGFFTSGRPKYSRAVAPIYV